MLDSIQQQNDRNVVNVGDRVRSMSHSYSNTHNKVGTIKYLHSDINWAGIEFDININGHSGNGRYTGKPSHCYNVHIIDLHMVKCTNFRSINK